MKTRVLVVDDDPAMCAMLEARLGNRGLDVTSRTSPADVSGLVAREDFDVLVTDINLKGMTGLDLCRQVLDVRPNLPVILITAFGTMEAAILAIRAGAYDFLPKPFEIDQLVLAVERGVALSRLKDEVHRLRRAVAAAQSFDEIVGASPRMMELFALLDKVAGSDAPVLVTGESGTGKELVAHALHKKGPRAAGPFVAVNCAAMPEALLESELFGHVKGAFTDAKAPKMGIFVAASGGTIFLDEIGELPLGLQPKILRALQEHKVRPVGSTAEVAFDARVIAATNRDLETMVEERTFREDLFFRINVIQVPLPPLRARGGDILILAQRFLERIAARANKRIAGFSSEAAQKLVAYAWPGNVRELENSIERAVALASFDEIAVGDLPEKVRTYKSNQIVIAGDDPSELVSLDEMVRRYVMRVFESVSHNKSAAARILHIERKTLHRMLQRWGFETPEQ
jgi:two-component system, NtrC family, response regulator HydG